MVGAAADLTTLASLLSRRRGALLTGPGPFTVFAPDNDAFAIIDLASLQRDPELLARTLEHHVVAGALPTSALRRTSTVSPLHGDPLAIEVAATAASSWAAYRSCAPTCPQPTAWCTW